MSCCSILALAIALLCNGGQSPTSGDALAIDATIQSRHLPFGGILDPIFATSSSESITGYTRCGDSALWTGHYLAAESYRYQVSGDPAALANAQGALAYLKTLVDVTGTDVLARCIVPINSNYAAGITSEESANGIHASGDDYWIGNTSRDEYMGVFFGLSVAYDLLDSATQPAIQALATRLLDFLTAHGWNIVMPDGTVSTTFVIRPDEQLGLLQIGRQINPSQFASAYQSQAALDSALASLPVIIDVADVRDSYFKFNLDAINLFSLIRLETDPTLLGRYQSIYQTFHNAIKTHGNAHFNMLDRALNGPNRKRDLATVSYLRAWLFRPRRDFYVDVRGQFTSCVSSDQSCDPVPVVERVTTDFLWQRSPFQLDGGGSGLIESAGIDYILPYWMARYYHLLSY
ncbi:MAG: hypothetical protein ABSG13_02870 [Bryobacteraceae bacterium]